MYSLINVYMHTYKRTHDSGTSTHRDFYTQGKKPKRTHLAHCVHSHTHSRARARAHTHTQDMPNTLLLNDAALVRSSGSRYNVALINSMVLYAAASVISNDAALTGGATGVCVLEGKCARICCAPAFFPMMVRMMLDGRNRHLASVQLISLSLSLSVSLSHTHTHTHIRARALSHSLTLIHS